MLQQLLELLRGDWFVRDGGDWRFRGDARVLRDLDHTWLLTRFLHLWYCWCLLWLIARNRIFLGSLEGLGSAQLLLLIRCTWLKLVLKIGERHFCGCCHHGNWLPRRVWTFIFLIQMRVLTFTWASLMLNHLSSQDVRGILILIIREVFLTSTCIVNFSSGSGRPKFDHFFL